MKLFSPTLVSLIVTATLTAHSQEQPTRQTQTPSGVSSVQQCDTAKPTASSVIEQDQARQILEELRAIRLILTSGNRGASRPRQMPADIRLSDDAQWPSLGSDTAPITIVEFGDYQCPFCKRFYADTFPRLKEDFIDKGIVRVQFRDLPLPMHSDAMLAAEAARCGAVQGRFAAIYDVLMSTSDLRIDSIVRASQRAGLDQDELRSCINAHNFKDQIDQSAKDAFAASIYGTPTLVIGTRSNTSISGVVITGAVPYASLENAITQALRTAIPPKTASD